MRVSIKTYCDGNGNGNDSHLLNPLIHVVGPCRGIERQTKANMRFRVVLLLLVTMIFTCEGSKERRYYGQNNFLFFDKYIVDRVRCSRRRLV